MCTKSPAIQRCKGDEHHLSALTAAPPTHKGPSLLWLYLGDRPLCSHAAASQPASQQQSSPLYSQATLFLPQCMTMGALCP